MKTVFSILFLLCASLAWSQCQISVFDELQNPLPLAHIKLIEPLSGNKKFIITNNDGLAEVPAAFCKKQVNLEVSFVGFEKKTFQVLLDKSLIVELSPDYNLLNQVVVTAQYGENNTEKSVQRISIIDEEKIQKSAATNLQEALEQQTNIRISQDQLLGAGISIQGLSGQNVKILIDGVPVVGRLNGNIDLNQINLQDVERIELVEGPMAVSYGTDALAGTINIISKDLKKDKGSVGLNSYYESAGQYNISLNSAISNKVHHYGFSASRNYFDGWNPDDKFFKFPQKTIADSSRVQAWKPKEQVFGKLKYKYSSGKVSLSAGLNLFQEEVVNRGFPRAPYQIRAFDDIYLTQRNDLNIKYTHKINDLYQVESFLAINRFNRYKNTFVRDLSSLQAQLSENKDNHDTSTFHSVNSRGTFSKNQLGAKFNYQVGYDVNLQQASGARIESKFAQMSDLALFGSAEIKVKEFLKLRPGLRYAYNSLYQAPLIPSLNTLLEWNKFKLRASYAKGFRAPSLKELYFNFVDINHNIVGNPNLKAEESNHVSAALKWKTIHKQQAYTVELTSYANQLNNLINLSQQAGSSQFSYQNIGEARTAGAAIRFNYAMPHLDFSLEYAENGISYKLEEESSKFSFSTDISSSLSLKFLQQQAHISLFYKHNGARIQTFTNENGEQYLAGIEAFNLLDITLGKSFIHEKLKLSAGCKNALDVRSVNNLGSTGTHKSGGNLLMNWGRTMFIAVNYHL